MSAFEQLWSSTAELYARYGLDRKSIPPYARRRIFMEEVLELVEASTDLEFTEDNPTISNGTKYEVAGEAADVVVTVIGLLQAHGITAEQFDKAMEAIARKNDAKREPEYQLIGGKIRRVEPVKPILSGSGELEVME